jgi:hypothetical protein
MLLTKWLSGVHVVAAALDLAKNIFPLPGVDQIGEAALLKPELLSARPRRSSSPGSLLAFQDSSANRAQIFFFSPGLRLTQK